MAPSSPILVKGLCLWTHSRDSLLPLWSSLGLGCRQQAEAGSSYSLSLWLWALGLHFLLKLHSAFIFSVVSLDGRGLEISLLGDSLIWHNAESVHSSPVTHSLCNISEQILEASWALLLNHHRPTWSRFHRVPWEEVKRRLCSPKWNDHLFLGFFVFCCVCTLSSISPYNEKNWEEAALRHEGERVIYNEPEASGCRNTVKMWCHSLRQTVGDEQFGRRFQSHIILVDNEV